MFSSDKYELLMNGCSSVVSASGSLMVDAFTCPIAEMAKSKR